MGKNNGVEGLIHFIGRDDVWRERLAEVVDEHLGPALEEFDVDFDELGELLGEPWPMVLWGCGFEDLLGRNYGPQGDNIVDIYLKRRGWKESVQNRAYIEGLRAAPVSLYEVSQIVPGSSMVLRDLLTDAEPVKVREKSATRSLKPWDRIAVRVVGQRDRHIISGALLPFSPEAVDLLLDGIRHALNLGKRKKLRLSPEQLQRCAPLFTTALLFAQLPKVLDPEPPQLANTDGDELVFHDLRFPLAAGVVQKDVAARLSRVAGLDTAGPRFWNWLAVQEAHGSRPQSSLAMGSGVAGATVLGTLELKGKALTLSVNSAARAKRGEAMILDALGDLLKPPLTGIRTVEQVMAEQGAKPSQDETEDMPPEIARQIVRDQLERHYRDTLDHRIPALGGQTPRQAVRSASGRKKVVEWLKLIENRSASQPGSPMAEYDFQWMWDELGLSDERQ